MSGKGATWGPILLGVFGLCLVVAGIFVTDPSLGYPPGTHGSGPQTLHGTIHGVSGLVVFSALSAACFVLARRFMGDSAWRGWALYSIVTGCMVEAFFVASTVMSVLDENGTIPNGPTGLLQRVAIVAGWGWIVLIAARLLRMVRSRAGERS